jgi:hypothetical protein
MNARDLLVTVQAELEPIERRLAGHRYLAEVEAGRVPVGSLRALAGEQRAIIASDQGSFEHLARRFPEPPAGQFFRDMAAGEAEALERLPAFADVVGLVADYEPLPGCQAYPAYVAWLALNGSPGEVALAFLANLETWGRSCGRLRDALGPRLGPGAVSFFDFFATPAPGFRDQALELVAGAEPRAARQAARLLQAYELSFWDTLAAGLS